MSAPHITEALVKIRRLDRPVSMRRTRESWERLHLMWYTGVGNLAQISDFAGIPRDAVWAMAMETPWMPWSEGMCRAVDEVSRGNRP